MNLEEYLFGTSPIGMSHRDRNGKQWAADNIHQLVAGPLPDQFQLAKGFIEAPCRFEELRRVTVNGKRYAARGWDTSDRPNVYRLTEGAMPVSLWCPLDMEPGEWFRREATVTRYNYATGAVTEAAKPHVTWLCFDDIIFEWRNPGGVDVGKVIRLTVHDGEDGRNKPPFEEYIYAPKYGMVYWKDHATGRESYVNNTAWPNGVPQLRAEPLPKGHTFQPMPVVPATPPVTPPPTNNADIWFLRPTGFPYTISSSFGPRTSVWPYNHEGVDYLPAAGAKAPFKVLAPRDGVVDKVATATVTPANNGGYGKYVRIKHVINGEEWVSWLAHLDQQLVTEGQQVKAGDVVGYAGSTGNSSAIHLHWTLTNKQRGKGKAATSGYPIDDVVNPADYPVLAELPKPPAPVTPPIETPDTPLPFEIVFATVEEKNAVGQVLVDIGQRILAAPGRRIYISVTTE